jgi:hypothetical protein
VESPARLDFCGLPQSFSVDSSVLWWMFVGLGMAVAVCGFGDGGCGFVSLRVVT